MSVPTEQVPGVYHRRIGEVVVTALFDGTLVMPFEARVGIGRDEQEALLRAGGVPPPYATNINAFLLRCAGKTILVDTGAGGDMGPAAGKLMANLGAAGCEPDQVDAVLLTHLHIDHLGGLTDQAGAAAFPRAELYVAEAEVAHWTSDAAMAAAPEFMRFGFDLAKGKLAAYGGRVRRFSGGEVMPGVAAVALPGHTPGHTGYLVSSGTERLLIWGDALSVPAIQAPRPEVALVFDTDQALGTDSRRRMLQQAVGEDLLVTGMHLSFPGFSRVGRDGEGFRILAEPWSPMS